jgi:glycosyltransferase involved in cell wall biosynthesis
MKARHIEAAIRSIRHLPQHVDLIVVGTGDAIDRLRRLAALTNKELGRPAVRMIGELTDPGPAYAVADIVLGMGSSAARGLAFGKPLVVIGEHGVPEMFSPETSMAIFHRSFWNELHPKSEHAAIEDVLAPLVDRAELRDQLGDFGRAFAENNFSLNRMAERLAGLYHSMALIDSWKGGWILDSFRDLGNVPRIAWAHTARPRSLHWTNRDPVRRPT